LARLSVPGRIVNVFDARLAQAKLGLLEQAAEPLVFASEAFGVYQQAEAFIEGQLRQLGFLCCSVHAAAKASLNPGHL
jgi:hypothetical protein